MVIQPPIGQQTASGHSGVELFLDIYDKSFPLGIDGVLGVEQLAALGVARLLYSLDGFLRPQFVLQRLLQYRRLAGLAYLFIDLFDFPLQPLIEIFGPAVQLENFFVGEFPVAFI